MNRSQSHPLDQSPAARRPASEADSARQIGSRDAIPASTVGRAADRALVWLLFPLLAPLMRLAARVYFQRLSGVGLDRLGPRSPALLLANHPAAWTDALILDVVLRRRVHFVTYERLFQPWPRGWFLRLFGSLPIRFGREEDAAFINRRTFDRCQAILSRGAVVGFFPEGVSGDDRVLLPLKTGAARLVIERMREGIPMPPIIPVALHYEDRTGFRRNVTVVVGAPIALPAFEALLADPVRAAAALTERFATALHSLLVEAEDAARRGPDPRAAENRGSSGLPAAGLQLAALVGGLLHLVPLLMVESIVRIRRLPPQQIALARISLGTILILLWYALLVALAIRRPSLFGPLLLMMPVLGGLACVQFDRARARRSAKGIRP